MECKDIREKLSAYLEGAVSHEEKATIEKHLKSCRECSQELSQLSKTIEHLKNLEEVSPPLWLTRKVMARIKEESVPRKGLLQKLFYPLHIKLPIEAAATVLVVGLALYIFRDMPPEVKFAQAPTEKVAPQVFEKEQQVARKDAEDKGVTQPLLPLDKGRKEEGLSLKAEEAGKKEEAKVPSPAKSPERAPAAGALAKDEARQEIRAAAPKAKLSLMEKKDEKLLTLIVLVENPEAAVVEIEKTLKELEGRAIHMESLEGKKVVTTILKADKLHALSEKLKVIGEIKEKEADLRGQERDIMVRVEVIENPQRP